MSTTNRTNRRRRHARIRMKVSGTAQRPRIAVFKSNQHTGAQAIDDVSRTTIAMAAEASGKGTKVARALAMGKELAKALKAKKITTAVFDKGGFAYHGRVKAIADGLREGGINI